MSRLGIRNALKHHAVESFFHQIDSEAKAYILGLLWADGFSNFESNLTGFTTTDEELMAIFLKELRSNHHVNRRNDGNPNHKTILEVRIFSCELADDLAALGFSSPKSNRDLFPRLPKGLRVHFIRGLLDGDGGPRLKNNRKAIETHWCGGFNLLTRVAHILVKQVEVSQKTPKPHGNTYRISYAGNWSAFKLAFYLYEKATLYLPRKKELMTKLLPRYKTQKLHWIERLSQRKEN